jgi:hypothetical protein
MKRSLIATVLVSGLTFSVYLVTGGGTVENQRQWLISDAGISVVTHAATCPVRVSPECVAAAQAASIPLKRYSRLSFPVSIRVQPDAGRDVQLPPMNHGVADECIHVMDWADCTLDSSGAAVSSVSGLLGQQLPFTVSGVATRWVRAKADAGLPCLRRATDGGSFNFGDRNVFPASEAVSVATCEAVGSGVIYAGSNPETDL